MSAQNPSTAPNNNLALGVLTSLFFMMGFITCMNDILIPHLKSIFNLSYTQAMLVQFCFFTAYALMSIPAGKLVEKIGYKGGVIGGFLIAAFGCIIRRRAARLIPSSWARCSSWLPVSYCCKWRATRM